MSAADIEQLERWIAAGAQWPESDYDREAARDRRLEHWAFQPLREYSPRRPLECPPKQLPSTTSSHTRANKPVSP
jgi:hypothetical protein